MLIGSLALYIINQLKSAVIEHNYGKITMIKHKKLCKGMFSDVFAKVLLLISSTLTTIQLQIQKGCKNNSETVGKQRNNKQHNCKQILFKAELK